MGTTLNQQHPQYIDNSADWDVMRDVYKGQRPIKAAGNIYLPYTSGQRALGVTTTNQEGYKLYDAYRLRAYFPEIVRDTTNALVGAMTREPANIQLPAALEDMRERATPKGETLNVLYKRILENQLLYGRRGLLLDIDSSRDLPYIVDYSHKQITNWDDINVTGTAERKLVMTILDESRDERRSRDEFNWTRIERFRLLSLDETTGKYTTRVDVEGSDGEEIVPALFGKTLDEIPFVFINTMDLVPAVGEIPLLGLGNLNLTIYRGEADYRYTLFMTGQDTLVISGTSVDVGQSNSGEATGEGSSVIIGSGALINIPDPEGDAKFIGVEGQGLAEQRTALENDYARAEAFGLKLLNSGSGAEAAETIRMRVAGKTANLATTTMTAAAGLQEILRIAARWRGANEDEVIVEPNLDFVSDQMLAKELVELVQAKRTGAPLSWRSIHNVMRRRDLTEMTFEDELTEIEGEPADESNVDRDLAGEDDETGSTDDTGQTDDT